MPLLSTPDTELHYELSGSGPPLLLIQGVGCIGETWKPQVKGLSNEWQTMIFDNRGIGRSQPCRAAITIQDMAADAQALMDAAGWESAHVVGHSMGGLIAQQLALDAPHRVRSLSLQCTFSRGAEAARLTPWVLWMNLRIRLGTRRARRRAFLKMVMPPGAVSDANADTLASEMSALVGRDLCDQPPILMKQVMAMSRHDISSKLGALAAIPTMVLSAEHDPIALPAYGRGLASLIPGASFELLPGASHAVTIHSAETVNERMRAFFRTSQDKWGALPR
jgi:pimeloyl-ACP methyl ester carboxylesterase